MSSGSRVAVIALTPRGKALAERIGALLGGDDIDIYLGRSVAGPGFKRIEGRFTEFVGTIFSDGSGSSSGSSAGSNSASGSGSSSGSSYRYLVFVTAAGIAVRSIAPHLRDKTEDPGVLVVDEAGRNVISLLSGHVGGANEFTRRLAQALGANPVITTATDLNQTSALDLIAKQVGAEVSGLRAEIKGVNQLLVSGGAVGIYLDGAYRDSNLDLRGFQEMASPKPNRSMDAVVYVTVRKELKGEVPGAIRVVPRRLVVAVGSRRGVDGGYLTQCLHELMDRENLDLGAIGMVGTVDIKAEEPAIVGLASELGVPLVTVGRSEIRGVEDQFSKSEFVKEAIGVYSVVEPVAHLLSGGNLIVGKQKYKGVTLAIGDVATETATQPGVAQ